MRGMTVQMKSEHNARWLLMLLMAAYVPARPLHSTVMPLDMNCADAL